jgi:hypothetical protein
MAKEDSLMLLFFCCETEELWVNTKPCFLKMVCGNILLREEADTTKTELYKYIPLMKKKSTDEKEAKN